MLPYHKPVEETIHRNHHSSFFNQNVSQILSMCFDAVVRPVPSGFVSVVKDVKTSGSVNL